MGSKQCLEKESKKQEGKERKKKRKKKRENEKGWKNRNGLVCFTDKTKPPLTFSHVLDRFLSIIKKEFMKHFLISYL